MFVINNNKDEKASPKEVVSSNNTEKIVFNFSLLIH